MQLKILVDELDLEPMINELKKITKSFTIFHLNSRTARLTI